MLLRKPAILLTSSNAISNSLGSTSHAQSASGITSQCRLRRRRVAARRLYATVNDDDKSRSGPDIPWPEPGHPTRVLTPYQIFNQKPHEPYSKRRFYELVKLYHPDRHSHIDSSDGNSHPYRLSKVDMLERYRLIVAANSILSDPLKREAYDQYGAGWSYHTVTDVSPDGQKIYKYTTSHRWRADGSAAYQWPTDQDPMYNANWEDWERWYQKQYEQYYRANRESSSSWSSNYFSSRRPRSPLYASNHAFISAVFILAALGGVGQATRVEETNRWRMERTQAISDRANESLAQARQDSKDRKTQGETKDKRIRRFLSEHGNYEEGEFDARALRAGDDGLCASGEVKDRDQPKFWEKPPER